MMELDLDDLMSTCMRLSEMLVEIKRNPWLIAAIPDDPGFLLILTFKADLSARPTNLFWKVVMLVTFTAGLLVGCVLATMQYLR